MDRDPKINPVEGDELDQRHGDKRVLVDKVTCDWVGYRVVDPYDGLCGAYRTPLSNWRRFAPKVFE